MCPMFRCLEATGVPKLNAQSPSELRWRLRVKSREIYGFVSMMDSKHTIWTHGQSRLPSASHLEALARFIRSSSEAVIEGIRMFTALDQDGECAVES